MQPSGSAARFDAVDGHPSLAGHEAKQRLAEPVLAGVRQAADAEDFAGADLRS